MAGIHRRRFVRLLGSAASLAAVSSLAAQQPDPELEIVWLDGDSIPAEFASESIVFPRAYTVCPDPALARHAAWSGEFPHRLDGPVVIDQQALTENQSNRITVMTAFSGDGGNSFRESSLQVPLAIRWPGFLEPRVMPDVLISHVDIFPTFLGLRGAPIPERVQGRDLSGLLLIGQGEVPDSVYCEGALGTAEEWRAVIRGYDKLVIRWADLDQPSPTVDDVEALYNLAEDPREEFNLIQPADLERFRDARGGATRANLAALQRDVRITADSMLALARDWQRRTGDGRDASGLRIRRPVLQRPK